MAEIKICFEEEKNMAAAYDGEALIGECDYLVNGYVWSITRTFVEKAYGGQGIAGKLVDEVAEQARKEGAKLIPLCTYAAKRMSKDDSYQDVLTEEYQKALPSLERLKKGNQEYLEAKSNPGDVSLALRQNTATNGQHPFACVICCSDSRVIPEAIFSCGIGSLFVIRTAGNTIAPQQLGSIQYAVNHLHVPLVLMLGHTHCGAVGAALTGSDESYISSIVEEIQKAIGDEKDEKQASILNVQYGVKQIQESLTGEENEPFLCLGALYDIETGEVEWLK